MDHGWMGEVGFWTCPEALGWALGGLGRVLGVGVGIHGKSAQNKASIKSGLPFASLCNSREIWHIWHLVLGLHMYFAVYYGTTGILISNLF